MLWTFVILAAAVVALWLFSQSFRKLINKQVIDRIPVLNRRKKKTYSDFFNEDEDEGDESSDSLEEKEDSSESDEDSDDLDEDDEDHDPPEFDTEEDSEDDSDEEDEETPEPSGNFFARHWKKIILVILALAIIVGGVYLCFKLFGGSGSEMNPPETKNQEQTHDQSTENKDLTSPEEDPYTPLKDDTEEEAQNHPSKSISFRPQEIYYIEDGREKELLAWWNNELLRYNAENIIIETLAWTDLHEKTTSLGVKAKEVKIYSASQLHAKNGWDKMAVTYWSDKANAPRQNIGTWNESRGYYELPYRNGSMGNISSNFTLTTGKTVAGQDRIIMEFVLENGTIRRFYVECCNLISGLEKSIPDDPTPEEEEKIKDIIENWYPGEIDAPEGTTTNPANPGRDKPISQEENNDRDSFSESSASMDDPVSSDQKPSGGDPTSPSTPAEEVDDTTTPTPVEDTGENPNGSMSKPNPRPRNNSG